MEKLVTFCSVYVINSIHIPLKPRKSANYLDLSQFGFQRCFLAVFPGTNSWEFLLSPVWYILWHSVFSPFLAIFHSGKYTFLKLQHQTLVTKQYTLAFLSSIWLGKRVKKEKKFDVICDAYVLGELEVFRKHVIGGRTLRHWELFNS